MTTRTTDVSTIPLISPLNLQLTPKSSSEVALAERRACEDSVKIVRIAETSLCYYHYNLASPPRPVCVLCTRLSPVITGEGVLQCDDYLLEIDSYVKGTGKWQQMAQVAQKSFGHQPAKVPTPIYLTEDRVCFPLDLEALKRSVRSCAIICSYPVIFFRSKLHSEGTSSPAFKQLYTIPNDWQAIASRCPPCPQCAALSHKEEENPETCSYVSGQMSQLLQTQSAQTQAVQILGKTYVEKRVEIRFDDVEVSVRIEGQGPTSLGKFSKSLLFISDL